MKNKRFSVALVYHTNTGQRQDHMLRQVIVEANSKAEALGTAIIEIEKEDKIKNASLFLKCTIEIE